MCIRDRSYTKTYGDAPFSLGAESTTGTVSYKSSNEDVVTVAADGTVTIHNKGMAIITVSVPEGDNHTIVSKEISITVMPKAITVKAKDASKIYGDADSELTYEVLNNGLVGNDTLENIKVWPVSYTHLDVYKRQMFGHDNVILIPDPVYPVYVDSNTMCGNQITYISANAENDFLPLPNHDQHVDLIYICSPNNPTGACYNKEQLKEWVDYALENEAVILFDSAYEAFISDPELPRSIYAIEGAKKCAIEFCSLSKTAGFTGTRCGYTVVPKELVFKASTGEEMSIHNMWNRRQSTKYNGTAYICLLYTSISIIIRRSGILSRISSEP